MENDKLKYDISYYHVCLGKCGNLTSLQVTGAIIEHENDPKITVIHTKNLKNLLAVLLMSSWNDRLELRVGDVMLSWMWIPINESEDYPLSNKENIKVIQW